MNKLILGTVQFGSVYGINNRSGKPELKHVFRILDFAYKNGIHILDTADAYGNAGSIVGKYHTKSHTTFQINTKFSKGNVIEKQLFQSLKSLNISSINTYFFHNFNNFKEQPGIIEQLEELKQKGLIEKIGVSIYDNTEFDRTLRTSSVDVIQFPFNLLDNNCQRGFYIDKAKEYGKELQIRSVFLQGLFFMDPDTLPKKLLPLKQYLEKIYQISHGYEIPINALALLYTIAQDKIDRVIIGVDTLDQLRENFEIIEKYHLIDSLLKEIDNIRVEEVSLLYPKNWKE